MKEIPDSIIKEILTEKEYEDFTEFSKKWGTMMAQKNHIEYKIIEGLNKKSLIEIPSIIIDYNHRNEKIIIKINN